MVNLRLRNNSGINCLVLCFPDDFIGLCASSDGAGQEVCRTGIDSEI